MIVSFSILSRQGTKKSNKKENKELIVDDAVAANLRAVVGASGCGGEFLGESKTCNAASGG